MRALLIAALSLFCLSGCTSLETQRKLYLAEHPDLASYKVDAMLRTPAAAVLGMTLEEVKLVLGPRIYREASYSDGITVYRSGLSVLLYFRQGQLSYWSEYR